MPELPEVETVLRGLKQSITGEKIINAFCSGARVFRNSQSYITDLLPGQSISSLQRRGKYLIIKTSRNYLVVHLGMTGQLMQKEVSANDDTSAISIDPHIHLIIRFDSRKVLIYRDPRKFGRILFFATDEALLKFFARLGIEPLSESFTLAALCATLEGKKGRIKPFLMNQSYICGLGNIYADESLFAAALHPETPVPMLTKENKVRLHQVIPEILKKGINSGGTTFRDYRNSNGEEGSFQNMLNVYGRDGLECPKCGDLILRIQVGGRSSHFCPTCQKSPL